MCQEHTCPHESAKHLHKAKKLLAHHAEKLFEQDLDPSVKQTLARGLKHLSHCLERVGNDKRLQQLEQENSNLRAGLNDFRQNRDKLTAFKEHLHKITSHTQALKERLFQLESASSLKGLVEEQEHKINLLAQEKEILSSHNRALQNSLAEQGVLLEHLQAIPHHAPRSSFKESQDSWFKEDRVKEKILQKQIAGLDIEIEMLQKSLQKALE